MTESGGNSGNMLYYGDNLQVLKQHVKDDSVDLVYLDPPFKSNQDYNVLFAEKNGSQSAAQIKAFEDTWQWDQTSAKAYEDVVSAGGRTADAMEAMKRFLGTNDMMAYISMMAPRLLELRRVLKSTGSIYLHCDPTACHYLKLLMDSVFGPENFKNEIIWVRSSGFKRSSARKFPVKNDTILFYTKSKDYYFNHQYRPHSEEYIRRFKPDATGRLCRTDVNPTGGGRRTIYLDDVEGVVIDSVWSDINPVNPIAKERLGYPTQKPEALLERIISASSREGETVLDPFCGCGTSIAVAQRLNRRWIGIDITHLAISLMKHRLADAFGEGVSYKVIGEPTDLEGARNLSYEDGDKYQFQWWALGLVGARPVEQKKGADKGIDGRLYFFVEKGKAEQIIFSVKGGGVTVSHVRDLRGVLEREKAAIGVLISLEEPTGPMRAEAADAGFYTSKELGNPKYSRIQLLTIKELLDGKAVHCPHIVGRDSGPTFKKAPKAKRVPRKSKEKQSRLSEHNG